MKYYTVADVAKYFNIRERKVIDLCKQNRLRSVKIGRQYRISDEAIGEFVKNEQ